MNNKLIAKRLRAMAEELENENALEKADALLNSNPAKFKSLWNAKPWIVSGPFASMIVQAILPSELNQDEKEEMQISKDLKDDIEDWLDDEEAGIIMECAVDSNPKIYLKITDSNIGAVDYIGISSFSSYPYSEDYLNGGKRLDKQTLEKEDWDVYYNPLLNIKDELEDFLSKII